MSDFVQHIWMPKCILRNQMPTVLMFNVWVKKDRTQNEQIGI